MKLSKLVKKINHKADKELLFLRITIGIMFMIHGYPKLFAGPDKWVMIGTAMHHFGIHFFPTFWGLMASIAEFVGGLCLVIGLFFRPMVFLMIITMIVASLTHIMKGDGIQGASHAMELSFVLIYFFSKGAGKYSIDRSLFSK